VSSPRFVDAKFEAPGELEDELVGRLWALGCRGAWSEAAADGRILLHVFFPAGAAPDPAELVAAAGNGGDVRLLAVAAAEERDWAAEWAAAVGPIRVGERFLVDPGEDPAPGDAGGRFRLRLPARTAFGLGSHESTRLAVELLESEELEGRRVLDVGTGSGILAFAAALLGAARVDACDVDPAAALVAEQYRRANRVERVVLWVGSLAALGPVEAYDLAVVNVVPAEIAADLPALVRALAPGGRALFSGILAAGLDDALAALAPYGLVETARRQAGEWAAVATELGR